MASDSAVRRGGVFAAAWLGYLLFYVYGSLVPLNLQPQPLAQAWQAFLALPGPHWPEQDRVDAAVNFLLLVPLGLAAAHGAARWRSAPTRVLLGMLAWMLLSLLAVGVEFAQMLFPPRDPSWSDVAAQSCGALAGGLAYMFWGHRLRALFAGLQRGLPARRRATTLLVIYLGLLLVFSVMPLDLTLSPVELYRKWRDGRVLLLPFASVWAHAAEPALLSYELASDIVLWVPVGLLWRSGDASIAQVLRRGIAAAALVEGAQLLVLSRVTDVTDVMLAGVGVLLGAACVPGLRRWADWPQARQSRALVVAWSLWLVGALFVLWAPFQFSASAVHLHDVREAFTRLPFQTYYMRGEFPALTEILRKLLVFLPGGLLLGLWAECRPRPLAAWPPLLTLALLAWGLEFGQLFEHSKLADGTDAMLGFVGGVLGWWWGRSLMRDGPAAGAVTPPTPSAHGAIHLPSLGTGWSLHAALWVGLALLIWLAGRLPGLPYNVAKLMPSGPAGLLAAAALALVLWWVLAAPLWVLEHGPRARKWWVPGLLLHGLMIFLLLRMAVPLPMMHKLIGTPVLGWGGPWEDLGRWLALHLSVMLPLVGGVLLARLVWRPATLPDMLLWVCAIGVLAGPLHWIVVVEAGTDNLVELMRSGGSLRASSALAGAVLAVAAAGSGLALLLVQKHHRAAMAGLTLLALAVAPALLTAGLEPLLLKYDRAFSALQFILSAARDRYAEPGELSLRLALALGVAVALVATLQAPLWWRLAHAGPDRIRRRPLGGALPAA